MSRIGKETRMHVGYLGCPIIEGTSTPSQAFGDEARKVIQVILRSEFYWLDDSNPPLCPPPPCPGEDREVISTALKMALFDETYNCKLTIGH